MDIKEEHRPRFLPSRALQFEWRTKTLDKRLSGQPPGATGAQGREEQHTPGRMRVPGTGGSSTSDGGLPEMILFWVASPESFVSSFPAERVVTFKHLILTPFFEAKYLEIK